MKDNFGRTLTPDEEATFRSMGRVVLKPKVEKVHGEAPGHDFRGNQFTTGSGEKVTTIIDKNGVKSQWVDVKQPSDKPVDQFARRFSDVGIADSELSDYDREIEAGMDRAYNAGIQSFADGRVAEKFGGEAARVYNESIKKGGTIYGAAERTPDGRYIASVHWGAGTDAKTVSKIMTRMRDTNHRIAILPEKGGLYVFHNNFERLANEGFTNMDHTHGEAPGHAFRGNQYNDGTVDAGREGEGIENWDIKVDDPDRWREDLRETGDLVKSVGYSSDTGDMAYNELERMVVDIDEQTETGGVVDQAFNTGQAVAGHFIDDSENEPTDPEAIVNLRDDMGERLRVAVEQKALDMNHKNYSTYGSEAAYNFKLGFDTIMGTGS
jgi:hypothetical protein